jgi:hypothetical protein
MTRRRESLALFKSFNTLWYNCSLADSSVSQNLSITLPLFKDPPYSPVMKKNTEFNYLCTGDPYYVLYTALLIS